MKEILSTKAQNNFGMILKGIRTEPVAILKYKKPVAVVISYDYFSRLVKQDREYWITRAEEAEAVGLVEISVYGEWLKKRYSGKLNSHVMYLRLTSSVLAYFDTVTNDTFEKMIKRVRKIRTETDEYKLTATKDYFMCPYKSRFILFRYIPYDTDNEENTVDDGILCVIYVSGNNAC